VGQPPPAARARLQPEAPITPAGERISAASSHRKSRSLRTLILNELSLPADREIRWNYAENEGAENPKMCKSQNRKEYRLAQRLAMLMSDELHNWLLLMALKVRKSSSPNRPSGLFLKQF
jgi:hypothetical protein